MADYTLYSFHPTVSSACMSVSVAKFTPFTMTLVVFVDSNLATFIIHDKVIRSKIWETEVNRQHPKSQWCNLKSRWYDPTDVWAVGSYQEVWDDLKSENSCLKLLIKITHVGSGTVHPDDVEAGGRVWRVWRWRSALPAHGPAPPVRSPQMKLSWASRGEKSLAVHFKQTIPS